MIGKARLDQTVLLAFAHAALFVILNEISIFLSQPMKCVYFVTGMGSSEQSS